MQSRSESGIPVGRDEQAGSLSGAAEGTEAKRDTRRCVKKGKTAD